MGAVAKGGGVVAVVVLVAGVVMADPNDMVPPPKLEDVPNVMTEGVAGAAVANVVAATGEANPNGFVTGGAAPDADADAALVIPKPEDETTLPNGPCGGGFECCWCEGCPPPCPNMCC